jgi:hypothetical protein
MSKDCAPGSELSGALRINSFKTAQFAAYPSGEKADNAVRGFLMSNLSARFCKGSARMPNDSLTNGHDEYPPNSEHAATVVGRGVRRTA